MTIYIIFIYFINIRKKKKKKKPSKKRNYPQNGSKFVICDQKWKTCLLTQSLTKIYIKKNSLYSPKVHSRRCSLPLALVPEYTSVLIIDGIIQFKYGIFIGVLDPTTSIIIKKKLNQILISEIFSVISLAENPAEDDQLLYQTCVLNELGVLV